VKDCGMTHCSDDSWRVLHRVLDELDQKRERECRLQKQVQALETSLAQV